MTNKSYSYSRRSLSWHVAGTPRVVEPQVRHVVVRAVIRENVCVVHAFELGETVLIVCHHEGAIVRILPASVERITTGADGSRHRVSVDSTQSDSVNLDSAHSVSGGTAVPDFVSSQFQNAFGACLLHSEGGTYDDVWCANCGYVLSLSRTVITICLVEPLAVILLIYFHRKFRCLLEDWQDQSGF